MVQVNRKDRAVGSASFYLCFPVSTLCQGATSSRDTDNAIEQVIYPSCVAICGLSSHQVRQVVVHIANKKDLDCAMSLESGSSV